MLGAAREMGFVIILFVTLFWRFDLVPFLLDCSLLRSFGVGGIEEIRDRRLDASEVRWVRACVDCFLDFVQRIARGPSCVFSEEVVADGRQPVEYGSLCRS